MALREQGFGAFADVDPQHLLSGIEARLAGHHHRRHGSMGRWLRSRLRGLRVAAALPAFAAATVAALGVVAVLPEHSVPPPAGLGGDAVRTKGSLSLRVFRQSEGTVSEVFSGTTCHAGDRLRFRADLPRRGAVPALAQIMVVGLETTGRLSTYYPADGTDRSQPAVVRPDGLLAGAVELDSYRGEEWLFLVQCLQPFGRQDLRPRPDSADLVVPDGCATTRFLLRKE
jgi:hypothetical protein